MSLRATVKGDEDAARHLLDVGRRARDPRRATRAAAEILQRGIADNFQSKGADFGEPWAPNAAATRERKGHGDVLEDSGRLARAMGGGSGKRKSSTKRGAKVGVGGKSLFYARFAQSGVEGHAPARRIVGVTATDRRVIVGLVSRYVREGRIV